MGAVRIRRLLPGVLIAAAALLASAVPAQAAPHRISIGFGEPLFGSEPAEARLWLERGRSAGGSIARLNVSWASIAPQRRPAGFRPADPGSPAYEWAGLDVVVRRVTRHGYRVLFTVLDAPRWAEGRGRPQAAPAGTWKPRPGAVRAFARAIARRYSGRFRQDGLRLPRVRLFQAWNEPNLSGYLSPQWRGRRPVSAIHYRALLNGFYAGVKAAQPRAKVLTGGTAPYGDLPGGGRVPPVVFWRRVLCLTGAQLRRLPCPRPAHLDILAHHPINVGGPTRSALNPQDASTPDFRPLRVALRRAVRTGRALPRRGKPLWATEIWWDSRPPDPGGVPLRRHARWYEQALYVLWRQRVRAVVFLQIVDAPPLPTYRESLQSGIFFESGRPKPARRALRFPLVVDKRTRRGPVAWGIAPRGGVVSIQRRRAGGWKTIARRRVKRRSSFLVGLPGRGTGRYRARMRSETSLVWRQR